MMARALRLAVGLAGLLCTGLPLHCASAAFPPWASAAAARSPSGDLGDADAVVLLSDLSVELAPNGRRTNRTRAVLRILKREGRTYARAAAVYIHPADKVVQLGAWLQNPGTHVRQFGRKQILDLALDPEALYSESRTAIINASAEALEGALFAWESVTEEPPGLAQAVWYPQGPIPVCQARCELRLPAAWQGRGRFLEAPPAETQGYPDGLVWELRNLSALKDEPLAPPGERAGALLAYAIQPPATRDRPPLLRGFSSWDDLAQFALQRFAPASKTTPAIATKVRELCAGKAGSWEQTRAIAAFVQKQRYVSIAANLRRDGGFSPRPAGTVLASGYGDCKDKVSLLCALLNEAGIPAYPVLCLSGDRTAVRPDWPSPSQFNHMVAAIHVDESVASPHLVEDPSGGRLLLFDPTDEYTPIGEYPVSDQGGRVLLCTPGTGRLVQIPLAPPASSTDRFSFRAKLSPDGSLAVGFTEAGHGLFASRERARRIERSKTHTPVADDIKAAVRGATTVDATTRDLAENDGCELAGSFLLPQYGHAVRKDLIAVQPLIAGSIPFPPFNEKERTRPIRLMALVQEVEVVLEIPSGFRVAEPGSSMRIERPYATYETNVTTAEREIVFHRRLVVQAGDLPPDEYEDLRSFLETARKRDRTPILIERMR